jgi:F-type H+-transporting ATPase subunit b
VQIDWITVLAQIANFLVLVWLLQRFLYAPITRAMAGREARIQARLAEAREAREEADAEAETLRARQRELADSREEILGAARDEAEALKRQRREEILAEIDEERRALRDRIGEEREDFARELKRRASGEVVAIVRKVLADFADTDLAAQLADEFAARLGALGTEERSRLAEAARGTRDPALVESGIELSPPARGRITRAIHEALDTELEVDYRTDEEVLLGLRLTIGGQTVEWSAARHLARLETALGEALEENAVRRLRAGG